jgi:hypothetical protein
MVGGIIGGASQAGMAVAQEGADLQAAVTKNRRTNLAITAGMQAAREKGDYQVQKINAQGTQLAAQQKSAYTNSGVDASSGTAAQVQANTAALSALDAQTAANNAAKEVWGFRQGRVQADENLAQESDNARRKMWGGILGGMSQFAGGAAQGSSLGNAGGDSASQQAGDNAFNSGGSSGMGDFSAGGGGYA